MRFFRPPRIEQGSCAATCFIVAYEMHIKEANGLVEVVLKKNTDNKCQASETFDLEYHIYTFSRDSLQNC